MGKKISTDLSESSAISPFCSSQKGLERILLTTEPM